MKKRGNISQERERRQAKVFTKWVNSHIKQRGRKIEDLEKDFDDGINLNILYEVISGDKSLVKKVRMKPRSRIEATANLSIVLQKVNAFVKEVGIGLSYSATQIADGDRRQILGMLWILITKFIIPESEENLSAKRSLLRWVQRVTEPYDNVKVKNFHRSWKDGLAFNALLHQFDNDLFDYSQLKAENSAKNLDHAFTKAEELGIASLLDVEDIEEFDLPDEKSVMFFHKFAGKKLAQDVKNFIVDVKKLMDWIKTSIEKFGVPESWPESIEECKSLEDGLHDFNKEKNRMADYKCNLYLRLAGIQRIQRNERLKVFVPDDDSNLNVVHEKWLNLNEVILKYSKELRDHILKLEEEKRQREEAEIKRQEEEEARAREEFRKKVEQEIKDREEWEKDVREKEVERLNENYKTTNEKIRLVDEMEKRRDEELQKRKEQEERKRRWAQFRDDEENRRIRNEEEKKKRDDENLKKDEERKKQAEERAQKEADERKRREEFRKKVEQEIDDREKEEREFRKNDIEFTDNERNRVNEKNDIVMNLIKTRNQEHMNRKDQERIKRNDANRRKKADERKSKEEEYDKRENADRIAREEFRKKCEDEIDKRESEERDIRDQEIEFQNKCAQDSEDKMVARNALVNTRTAENSLRDEQEKQKREDAKRREIQAGIQKKDEEKRKKEEEKAEQKQQQKEKRDEELSRKLEEEKQKRDDERRKREDEIAQKKEDERLARQKERERIVREKLEKEERERVAIENYDSEAAQYMVWVIKSQNELTQTEERAEDEEDLSTDQETKDKRKAAVEESKKKVGPIQEKWNVVKDLKIETWASIPFNEVSNAKDTMIFALTGEELPSLKEIRKFKL